MPLVLALREVQDIEHINELFAPRSARTHPGCVVPRGPHLDIQARGLKDYPPQTAGGIFYKQLMAMTCRWTSSRPTSRPTTTSTFSCAPGRRMTSNTSWAAGALISLARWCRTTCASPTCSCTSRGTRRGAVRVLHALLDPHPHARGTALSADLAYRTGRPGARRAGRARVSAPLQRTFEDCSSLPRQARTKAGIRGVRLADTSAASALWC